MRLQGGNQPEASALPGEMCRSVSCGKTPSCSQRETRHMQEGWEMGAPGRSFSFCTPRRSCWLKFRLSWVPQGDDGFTSCARHPRGRPDMQDHAHAATAWDPGGPSSWRPKPPSAMTWPPKLQEDGETLDRASCHTGGRNVQRNTRKASTTGPRACQALQGFLMNNRGSCGLSWSQDHMI